MLLRTLQCTGQPPGQAQPHPKGQYHWHQEPAPGCHPRLLSLGWAFPHYSDPFPLSCGLTCFPVLFMDSFIRCCSSWRLGPISHTTHGATGFSPELRGRPLGGPWQVQVDKPESQIFPLHNIIIFTLKNRGLQMMKG